MTMSLKLPRILLWDDKKTMDQLLAEDLGEQLYMVFMDIRRADNKNRELAEQPLAFLNEAFYQCTRVVYERDPAARLDNYFQNIKGSMGAYRNARIVMMLMLYLLKMQSDQSAAVRKFIEQLNGYFENPFQPSLFDFVGLHIDGIMELVSCRSMMLRPRPCPAGNLEYEELDWQELTQNFSSKAVKELLQLWDDDESRYKVMAQIERAYKRRSLQLFEEQPDDAMSAEDFEQDRQRLGLDENWNDTIEVCAEPYYDIVELERKVAMLEETNAKIKSENERLRSELNMTKDREEQERSFTLSMIVDYCMNRPELRQVEHIVAMLNRFLRGVGSEQEFAAVDGIEQEFARRMCTGIRIASANVEVNSPGNVISKEINYGRKE